MVAVHPQQTPVRKPNKPRFSPDSFSPDKNVQLRLLSATKTLISTLHLYRKVQYSPNQAGRLRPLIYLYAEAFVDELYRNPSSVQTSAELWYAYLAQRTLSALEAIVCPFAPLLVAIERSVLIRAGTEFDDAAQREIDHLARLLEELSQNVTPASASKVISYEKLLETDPCGSYPRMDEHSKLYYRLSLERCARMTKSSPSAVAQVALDLAAMGDIQLPLNRARRHVGYYLCANGYPLLLKELTKRWSEDLENSQGGNIRVIQSYSILASVGGAAFTALLLYIVGTRCFKTVDLPLLFSMAVLSSEGFNSVLDHVISILIPSRPLFWERPKLEVPSEIVVCIPTVLYSVQALDRIIKSLHGIRRDAQGHIAAIVLLTDFADSDRQTPGKQERSVLEYCFRCVEVLNATDTETLPILVLHRTRVYSSQEKCWMGFDRKRGKVRALCLLLSEGINSFAETLGDVETIIGRRYLFVLDDTSRCSRQTWARIHGTAVHPLNTPSKGLERDPMGYVIIQPYPYTQRESTARWGWLRWHFEGTETNESRPAFVRQTLWDAFAISGSYGKGLYHVAEFLAIGDRRIPQEAVLSHDILEAAFCRTAFDGAAAVAEAAPRSPKTYYERQHRWARGDWQNLYFLLSSLPRLCELYRQGTYTLGTHLVVKFVRRTFVPISRVIMLTYPVIVPSFDETQAISYYTFFVCGPELVRLVATLTIMVLDGRFYQLGALLFQTRSVLLREMSALTLAPQMAVLYLDAQITAAFRVLTRTRLLVWQSSESTEFEPHNISVADLSGIIGTLFAAFVICIGFHERRCSYLLVLGALWCVGSFEYWRLRP